GALTAQECRIVLGDRLGEHVRGLPRAVLLTLRLEDLRWIELGQLTAESEARPALRVALLHDPSMAQPAQHPVDGHAGSPGLAAREGVPLASAGDLHRGEYTQHVPAVDVERAEGGNDRDTGGGRKVERAGWEQRGASEEGHRHVAPIAQRPVALHRVRLAAPQ